MMQALTIKNLKCFRAVTLQFRRLTVLTGTNGAGKSTLIQAILLARQASEDHRFDVVQLNGPYCLEIGEADDALFAAADDQVIEVTLDVADTRFTYKFSAPMQQRSLHLPIIERPAEAPSLIAAPGMAFSYLNAERLGPRDQLLITSEDIGSIGVGYRGEYVAQALTLRERDPVAEGLRHPAAPTAQTLRAQVEAWMSDIVRPIRIDTQWPAGLTASIIRFQDPGLASEPLRPGNVGFGVSYALPVIVAGLAVGNGVLIVENPEAHLHPAGQSKLGRFLGRVAGYGTHVIVETHSDHVINGIRRAAVDDLTVSPADVIVHFFRGIGQQPVTINVTDRGGMSEWPPGFFDQLEVDLGRLARAKRRGD